MTRRKNVGNTKEINVVCQSIRRYREHKGLEQKELARRLGVADSAVGNWENGYAKPTLDVILPVCRVLGITLYELFDTEDPMMPYSRKEQGVLSRYHALNEPHKKAVSTLIDMLGSAEDMNAPEETAPELAVLRYFDRQLAAGIGDPTDISDSGKPLYLYPSALISKADYVFTVNGESMEPVYHNGDMVLVQKADDSGDMQPGDVGAFMIGNEAYIKECQPDGLHSYNKKYGTMRFSEEDRVFLIGRVIGVIDKEDLASENDIENYLRYSGE